MLPDVMYCTALKSLDVFEELSRVSQSVVVRQDFCYSENRKRFPHLSLFWLQFKVRSVFC